jgi:XrtJ-associated TM-motif-TM protein
MGINLLKKLSLLLAVFVMLIASHPVFAQGGCDDASPENPTAILALVGSSAGFLMVARSRFRKR